MPSKSHPTLDSLNLWDIPQPDGRHSKGDWVWNVQSHLYKRKISVNLNSLGLKQLLLLSTDDSQGCHDYSSSLQKMWVPPANMSPYLLDDLTSLTVLVPECWRT